MTSATAASTPQSSTVVPSSNTQSSSSSSQPLDFAALLSRDYRPARVARLIPREPATFQQETGDGSNNNNGTTNPSNDDSNDGSGAGAGGGSGSASGGGSGGTGTNKKKKKHSNDKKHTTKKGKKPSSTSIHKSNNKSSKNNKANNKSKMSFQLFDNHGDDNDDDDDDDDYDDDMDNAGFQQDMQFPFEDSRSLFDDVSKPYNDEMSMEACRLVLQLVSKTNAFTRHLTITNNGSSNINNNNNNNNNNDENADMEAKVRTLIDDEGLKKYYAITMMAPKQQQQQQHHHHHSRRQRRNQQQNQQQQVLSPMFHQVELEDWEKKIRWDGFNDESTNVVASSSSLPSSTSSSSSSATVMGDKVVSEPTTTTTATTTTITTATTSTTSGAGSNETSNNGITPLSTTPSAMAGLTTSTSTTPTPAATPGTGTTTSLLSSTTSVVPATAAEVDASNASPLNGIQQPVSAITLLQQRRNPFLENLSLDNISWSGNKDDVLQKARAQPLILELGVAGQSVARHLLPVQRPIPCVKSMAYQQRMLEAEWNGDLMGDINASTSASELSKGTLHADKEKMERLIQERQEKRRQMAKDKTNRVTEAMGTLDVLGGGRGRTITSSLMGPGGTERTGRPSRHIGNVNHDTEYVEQLDMVTNHALVRDLSKVTLRQYHRPKLPLSIVRTNLIWQFQIRYIPTKNKASGHHHHGGGGAGGDTANASSYQAIMMGTHAGAISKAKLRTETDLSPTEGTLVLMEYCEERPPVPLTKGMASKIVTYYRGDKSRCPVSAGGGDRPTRRKRPGNETGDKDKAITQAKLERPPRFLGPNHALKGTTITDWVGKAPKRTMASSSRDGENKSSNSINILPEGVTEILHPKVHGPFIGEIEEGQSVTGLISNLFVAPLFRHEPESTDFLMILGRNAGATAPGRLDALGVVLRELPTSVFTVGQTEPRTRVYAPNTQGEKNFIGPFVSYQIAKALSRTEAREGHGLRFDEIQDRVLPNLGLPPNALRQRLKQVAIYDKNTQIWTTKALGYEDYPGVDALGKQILPEGVAAYEVSSAAVRRLSDLGIHQLFSGSHAVGSVGVTMVYLMGQLNAAKEAARKVKKLGEVSRSNKSLQGVQVMFYETAASELDTLFKALRQKYEVAKFIYEELQLAPWHLTGEFIEVHKKAEGTGMMKLTGLGDPSGVGEGFSFLREVDSKPSKSVGAGPINAQNAQMKKITGTEDDLRKLTMKQMAQILRSYGMAQQHIDTLKRWDRVHVIRDLSTKAASDGIGDGLERFARGEKMKLSEQKQMYRDRIQVIWKRQCAALSADSGDGRASGADGGGVAGDADDAPASRAAAKKDDGGKDDSDSESEDDDFAAAMEEEMMDRPAANQLVAAQARDSGGMGADASLGQLRNAAQDQDMSMDARELAALKRQREEERAAREGMSSLAPTDKSSARAFQANRKIIRKRVTKTYPDGRQTTVFKFITHPEEVGKIMARLQQQKPNEKQRNKERPEYQPDDRLIGHAMFEDEDDFEYSSRGRNQMMKRRGGNRRARPGTTAKAPPRKKEFQFGKLKSKVTKEQRIKKRKRDEEEAELYASVSKRKGTSNRKERGSIRDRRPHVILADRFESIRSMIESRPSSGPFVKPVNRRQLPRYYEVISHPIDLSSIRDKIQKYEYRTADAFLKDFNLMKSNAIKFNGSGTLIAEEGSAIYQLVKDKIEEARGEFDHLEVAVKEQMSGKPKKKKKKTTKSSSPVTTSQSPSSPAGGGGGAATSSTVNTGSGMPINLGELPDNFDIEDINSESDGSLLLDLS